MQRKKLLIETKKIKKEDRENEYLPEKYWEGRLCIYEIIYLDMGDGEQYPMPRPVGELIRDLLSDYSRIEKLVPRGKSIKKLSPLTPVYIKNNKRVPLELRIDLE